MANGNETVEIDNYEEKLKHGRLKNIAPSA
jgi:hypothetical protein